MSYELPKTRDQLLDDLTTELDRLEVIGYRVVSTRAKIVALVAAMGEKDLSLLHSVHDQLKAAREQLDRDN